jgi:hypothetical protein
METLEFYVIRRKDGLYLRSRRQWGEGLKKAKVYTKKGGACAQVTAWSNENWAFGIPELIPIIGTLGEPIDQTERVMKSRKLKELKEALRQLSTAKREYDRAKLRLSMIHLSRTGAFTIVECEEKIKELETRVKELSKK